MRLVVDKCVAKRGDIRPSCPLAALCLLGVVILLRYTQPAGAQTDSGSPTASQSTNQQGQSVQKSDWWALQRPIQRPVPRVDDPRWSQNPIDAFVKKKLDELGLVPARRADSRVLVRRAYLDLVGLLPDPDEVAAFADDTLPIAYQKLVDRLLASPAYGERFGRHWLDVARYADSGGFEQDFDYPNAWRYRDYVIRAFNDDKPYNEFVAEQLAGDELDEVTFDGVIATGFNRVGPRVGFREKDNPQYRFDYLDDLIGTTSQAFMGLTIQCARCHDHKFDPISQIDYYQMMAIFFPYIDYDFPLTSPEVAAEAAARKAEIEVQVKPLQKQIAEIERPARRIALDKQLNNFPEYIQIAVRTPEEQRTPGQKLLAAQMLSIGGGSVRSALNPEDRAKVDQLRRQISELEKKLPKPLPVAMGIRDGDFRFAPDGPGDDEVPGTGDRHSGVLEGSFLPAVGKPYVPPKTFFLPSGDHRTRGAEVQPGFPRVLATGNPPTSHVPADGRTTTGRRRALAEWIVSEHNPLTARVIVNRIWQQHFGRGIVATPNNFGHMGQPPSHGELLDWLAVEFMRQGWSVKWLNRMIMNSETYRMASDHFVAANARIDATNSYLYRFPQRRLEAETIRDIILIASGSLNRHMGGKPFFPPVPEEVRLAVAKGIWNVTEEGPAVWRRSVYSYYKRGMRYPMFEVFDQPDPNVTCERRDVTTVPTQALSLLNNSFVLLQAGRFAERVLRDAGSKPDGQVRVAYQIALSREPSSDEIDFNVAFLRRQQSFHTGQGALNAELAAVTDLCHVILNLNEFLHLN